MAQYLETVGNIAILSDRDPSGRQVYRASWPGGSRDFPSLAAARRFASENKARVRSETTLLRG